MARLSAAQRSKLKPNQFAGPNRSFPVNDRGHALAAVIDVGRAVKAGHLTPEEASHIRAQAKAKL